MATSSLVLIAVSSFHMTMTSSLKLFNTVSFQGTQEVTFQSTNKNEVKINITYLGQKYEYEILDKYTFFIPRVHINCQCSCTDHRHYSCDFINRKCAYLMNSTTTCTIYNVFDKKPTVCPNYYELCCQAYFSKTKLSNSFKAVQLKFKSSYVNFKLTLSSGNGIKIYNVAIKENIKHLLLAQDLVLNIPNIISSRLLVDGWYYVDDGGELFLPEEMNRRGEHNLNKIGWFQFDSQLSRVKLFDLKEHLQIEIKECDSNPPKYEWRLEASFYSVSKYILYPNNVDKISDKYKGTISNISINLPAYKVILQPVFVPMINVSVSDGRFSPFIFTSNVTKTKKFILQVAFTRGSGSFKGEITSLDWSESVRFYISKITNASSTYNRILPSKNYKNSWLCLHQNDYDLCQILTVGKQSLKPKSSTETVRNFLTEAVMKNNSNVVETVNKNANVKEVFIGCIILLLFATTVFLHLKERQKKQRKIDINELEMHPLSELQQTTSEYKVRSSRCFRIKT